ncbi:MAG TPA: hypothetical protein VEH77_16680, partial [Roseiarcus sp.]|nr:hypothetical protein [Roseiarcus sp.]
MTAGQNVSAAGVGLCTRLNAPLPGFSGGHPPIARHDERDRWARKHSDAERDSCNMTDGSGNQPRKREFDP